jgi:hypothetical protein
MSPLGKKHDQEAGTIKRKLWSVLGVVLMMVFTLMACSSSDDNKSSAKAITEFKITSPVVATGVITEATHTIAITVPYNTSVINLVATFKTSAGASVKIGTTTQESGTTANSFASAVTYTVTAADASNVDYTVTITYAGGTWTKMADFGGLAREGAVSFGFAATGKGYIGTGFDGTAAAYHSDFWKYNSSTNAWTQKANFGIHIVTDTALVRAYAVGFAIGTKGYVGTGYNGTTYYKDLWEYDPATNVWTEKDDLPGTGTVERKDAVGFSIRTKGYIGTGSYGATATPTTYYKDFYEFNPAGAIGTQWTAKADFGGGLRASAVGLSIGAIGYIGTGYDGTTTPPTYYKDF